MYYKPEVTSFSTSHKCCYIIIVINQYNYFPLFTINTQQLQLSLTKHITPIQVQYTKYTTAQHKVSAVNPATIDRDHSGTVGPSEFRRGSLYSLRHGGECTAWVNRSLSCLPHLRDPAARPFVQDTQSAVRLPVSRSRRSRDRSTQAVARHFGRRERIA